MKEPFDFEPIRPYRDEEVAPALKRILANPTLAGILGQIMPHLDLEAIKSTAESIQTIRDFQEGYIYEAVKKLVEDTTAGLEFEGLGNLSPEKTYLYISNHRDIVLDPALLNYSLFEHGYDTCRNAIGDNLLLSTVVSDIMKLNKAFVVHRRVSPREFLAVSQRLSAYIQHSMEVDRESVWIAQRNGRTKNGHDRTNPALLKMLTMEEGSDLTASLRRLPIVPLTFSYEWEPCDFLKAEELFHFFKGIPYQKDDARAMMLGIREPKGRVAITAGKPLNPDDLGLDQIRNRNEQFSTLASFLDDQIDGQYHLWPNNYIAADLVTGKPDNNDFYTPKEKAAFEKHLHNRLNQAQGETHQLRAIMLAIYANPVRKRLGLEPLQKLPNL